MRPLLWILRLCLAEGMLGKSSKPQIESRSEIVVQKQVDPDLHDFAPLATLLLDMQPLQASSYP